MISLGFTLFTLCAAVVTFATGLVPVPNMDYKAYVKLGDINIGAIIPVHQYHFNAPCGGSLRELGVLQRMEALVFAVEEINNRTDLLQNITLGYIILDDCYKESTAVGKALQFVTAKGTCDANVTTSQHCSNETTSYDVIGLIGSESSANSMSIAKISNLYKIPQLSYLATSPELDNTFRFPYFFRTVPSDYFQAKAILDFLAYSNWTYVSILYSDSSYGVAGYQALQEIAKDKGICFAYAVSVQYNFSDKYFDELVTQIVRYDNKARAVIVYTPLEVARAILAAVKRRGHTETFTWIASDAWGRNIQDYEGLEETAWGIVAVKVNSQNVHRFDEHFSNLIPSIRTNNPWFQHFWEDVFNCSKGGCSSNDSFTACSHYTPDMLTSLVIDAVYTYAHAIDDALSKNCSEGRDSCYLNSCLTADVLTASLQNIAFNGEISNFTFDENGNGILDYKFQSIQKINNSFQLVHVATWSQDMGLVLDGSPLQFKNLSTIPISVCSAPCKPGYSQELLDYGCCWNCKICRPNEISVIIEGIMKCTPCTNKTWPDSDRTACLGLIPEYLSYDSAIGATLITSAGLGIIATFVVAILYGINNDHKLIKASGRELSYVMLFGIWVHYSAVFVFILKPTDWTCIVNTCTFGLSFCLVYAPLLTKSNRIYRIFESGRHGKIRPPMIDAKSQLMFTSILVLIKVVVLLVWIFTETPKAITTVTLGRDQNTLSLFCSMSMGAFGCIIGYNLLLILACCFHAFKTRKLPTNFNESRFISFCVYTTILMWLAFFPAYLTLTFGYYRTLFSCLALLVNATVVMICLFGTRLYGVYFVKKCDLHLMSAASGKTGLKSAAIAVKATVSINHAGTKVVPRRGSELSKEDVVNNSIETVETSNSDLDQVQVATPPENDLVIVSPSGAGEKYENGLLSLPEDNRVKRAVSFDVIENADDC
ncbi:metabotropic glutamate receptor-like [Lineus longissimus]|uniref:metabotropic glutamate receptor-like n=1 Tax=Lineus longissimus TaxID=88925 RepID=UPI002B4E0E9E